MTQLASLGAQEPIAMLGISWNCLELQFRKCLQMVKMKNLILQVWCYSPNLSICAASIWCLDCSWPKKMRLVVQVFGFCISSGKLHFHGKFENDFEFGWFWAYSDDPKSSSTSFGSGLGVHLIHLVKISRNGLFCSFLEKWLDLKTQICFGLGLLCL